MQSDSNALRGVGPLTSSIDYFECSQQAVDVAAEVDAEPDTEELKVKIHSVFAIQSPYEAFTVSLPLSSEWLHRYAYFAGPAFGLFLWHRQGPAGQHRGQSRDQ